MPRSSRRVLLALALAVSACGSSPARPVAAADAPPSPDAGSAPEPAAASAPEAPPPAAGIPTKCASPDAPLCTPDVAFVKRMCNGSFPDVALVLMGNPAFARMYMKGDVDGWNADGGASARARLRFDEEMLVLRRRAPPANGIVVGSGGAGYLVMRWDGNCYTLEDGELTAKKPAAPRTAPIPWRFFSEATKNALLATPKVLAAYQKRGKECKGAVSGEVSRACEAADAALSSAVVAEIRGGLAIPTPAHVP